MTKEISHTLLEKPISNSANKVHRKFEEKGQTYPLIWYLCEDNNFYDCGNFVEKKQGTCLTCQVRHVRFSSKTSDNFAAVDCDSPLLT